MFVFCIWNFGMIFLFSLDFNFLYILSSFNYIKQSQILHKFCEHNVKCHDIKSVFLYRIEIQKYLSPRFLSRFNTPGDLCVIVEGVEDGGLLVLMCSTVNSLLVLSVLVILSSLVRDVYLGDWLSEGVLAETDLLNIV